MKETTETVTLDHEKDNVFYFYLYIYIFYGVVIFKD